MMTHFLGRQVILSTGRREGGAFVRCGLTRRTMSEAIGIMNEAYFVGRHELIDWVNNLLKVNITKVEECCTGAIHCQIFDVLYPGKMNMTKVNFEAKHEYEFVKNFKLLQDMFDKVDIQHHVPVEKIIKGKYQDNLELLQWVYEVFNRTYNGGDYDPIKRRSKSKGGLSAFKGSRGGAAGMARALPGKENKVKSTTTATKKPAGEAVRQTTASAAATTKHAGQDDALAKAKKDIEEMHGVLKELEKERDWYFSKILDVEKICKEAEESPMIQQILEVLYATDNDIGADDHPISIDTTMGEQTV